MSGSSAPRAKTPRAKTPRTKTPRTKTPRTRTPRAPRRSAYATLRDGQRTPASYDTITSYFIARGLHDGLRVLIGLGTAFMAVVPALILLSPDGARNLAGQVVLVASVVHGLAWMVRWTFGPIFTRQLSIIYVFCADVAIIAASLAMGDALLGQIFLFALFLVAIYIAFFHSLRVLRVHNVLTLIAFSISGYAVFNTLDREVGLAICVLIPIVTLAVPYAIQVGVWALSNDAAAAGIDVLTELPNRRGFEVGARTLVANAAQVPGQRSELVIIIADLDHFKRVNDTFGHATGDAVLRATAGAIKRSAGIGAITARFGGEEFAVVAILKPGSAPQFAERIRRAVAAAPPVYGLSASPTVSIGAVATDLTAGSADDLSHTLIRLVAAADTALYRAKERGRDQVVVFGKPRKPEQSRH